MSGSPERKDLIQAILSNPTLNEEEKAALVERLIDEIKKEYPDLKNHATKADVKEIELKLTKEIKEVELKLTQEIENTRKEIKEIELKLTQEIENTRKEIKEIEGRLQKEIKEVESKLQKEIKEVEGRLQKEIKEVEVKLTKEIKETKISTIKWTFIFWITQIGVIGGMLLKVISLLSQMKG